MPTIIRAPFRITRKVHTPISYITRRGRSLPVTRHFIRVNGENVHLFQDGEKFTLRLIDDQARVHVIGLHGCSSDAVTQLRQALKTLMCLHEFSAFQVLSHCGAFRPGYPPLPGKYHLICRADPSIVQVQEVTYRAIYDHHWRKEIMAHLPVVSPPSSPFTSIMEAFKA